jgi:hypothetical protein
MQPEMKIRRQECINLAMLRRNGWRPTPDGSWVAPNGAKTSFNGAIAQTISRGNHARA